MRAALGSSACALVVLAVLAQAADASCVARKGLSGDWKASDNGTYRISIFGNEIWWIGETKLHTNVFKGTVDGNIITGTWADVLSSNGKHGTGTLRLEIVRLPGGGIAHLKKLSGTGSGFGAATWSYPCPQ